MYWPNELDFLLLTQFNVEAKNTKPVVFVDSLPILGNPNARHPLV